MCLKNPLVQGPTVILKSYIYSKYKMILWILPSLFDFMFVFPFMLKVLVLNSYFSYYITVCVCVCIIHKIASK